MVVPGPKIVPSSTALIEGCDSPRLRASPCTSPSQVPTILPCQLQGALVSRRHGHGSTGSQRQSSRFSLFCFGQSSCQMFSSDQTANQPSRARLTIPVAALALPSDLSRALLCCYAVTQHGVPLRCLYLCPFSESYFRSRQNSWSMRFSRALETTRC